MGRPYDYLQVLLAVCLHMKPVKGANDACLWKNVRTLVGIFIAATRRESASMYMAPIFFIPRINGYGITSTSLQRLIIL